MAYTCESCGIPFEPLDADSSKEYCIICSVTSLEPLQRRYTRSGALRITGPDGGSLESCSTVFGISNKPTDEEGTFSHGLVGGKLPGAWHNCSHVRGPYRFKKTKTCVNCHKVFTVRGSRQEFCDKPACRKVYESLRKDRDLISHKKSNQTYLAKVDRMRRGIYD